MCVFISNTHKILQCTTNILQSKTLHNDCHSKSQSHCVNLHDVHRLEYISCSFFFFENESTLKMPFTDFQQCLFQHIFAHSNGVLICCRKSHSVHQKFDHSPQPGCIKSVLSIEMFVAHMKHLKHAATLWLPSKKLTPATRFPGSS